MIGKTVNGFTLQRKLGEGGMIVLSLRIFNADNESLFSD